MKGHGIGVPLRWSSELPGRFGAFDALLRSVEPDIGQLSVIEAAEVLARPPPLAP
jgi:hypothetical protein